MWIAIEKSKLVSVSSKRCDTITYLYDITYLHNCNYMSLGNAEPEEDIYIYLTSGLIIYRKGERGGIYVIDKSEDGGLTWELAIVQLAPDEDSIIIDIDAGISGYRHLVRDGAYVIDEALTPLGFSGVEGLDWQNIYNTDTL
jgi:hypothetical protein